MKAKLCELEETVPAPLFQPFDRLGIAVRIDSGRLPSAIVIDCRGIPFEIRNLAFHHPRYDTRLGESSILKILRRGRFATNRYRKSRLNYRRRATTGSSLIKRRSATLFRAVNSSCLGTWQSSRGSPHSSILGIISLVIKAADPTGITVTLYRHPG